MLLKDWIEYWSFRRRRSDSAMAVVRGEPSIECRVGGWTLRRRCDENEFIVVWPGYIERGRVIPDELVECDFGMFNEIYPGAGPWDSIYPCLMFDTKLQRHGA